MLVLVSTDTLARYWCQQTHWLVLVSTDTLARYWCQQTHQLGTGVNTQHMLVLVSTDTLASRAKNNVRTTVNFRANDGKDRSNDYTSGHYDRPGEYSALNRYMRSCDARTARARRSIDRSRVHTYVRTCIYIYIHRRSMRRRTYVRS